MHAWPASEVPALPGKGRDLRIHDTATGGLVTLDPGPVARIYVCGITPYDATHMGHAATYNAFDLVQRVWLDTKRQVHYVQNVTDVDDPLLERAVRDGERLDRARRARDRPLPRGHDRPADAAAARTTSAPSRRYPASCRSSSGCGTPAPRTSSTATSTSPSSPTRTSARSPTSTPPPCGCCPPSAAATRTARARRTRSTRCCGWPPARASRAGTAARSAAAGPAGTSSASPSPSTTSAWASTSRAAAPTSPSRTTRWAPRTPRCSPASSRIAKAYVHAGMVALRRREDVQVQGQPGLRLRSCAATASTRPRSGWRCSPTTTGPTGSGPTRSSQDAVDRLGRWRAAVSRPDGPSADALVEEIREALADDLDAPAALAAVDRWAARQQETGRHGRGRARPRLAGRGRPARRRAVDRPPYAKGRSVRAEAPPGARRVGTSGQTAGSRTTAQDVRCWCRRSR